MNPLPPPSTRQRRLCVCADDFGLDAGINKAVLMLLEQGVVTATSCMVTRHAWVPGARVLRDVPPGATDVGLHLDLTNVDGSHRESSLKQLVRQAYLGQLDAVRLAGRIAEQLDRFEQAMGRMPDYVDGHRHVHQLPGVREALVEVMIDRYGPRPPWLRSTRPGGMAASTVIKQQLIYGLGGGRLHSAAQMHSVPISRRLLGVYDFSPTPDRYLGLLEHWVTNCRDGDVLMCHPALTTSSADPIAAARAQEFFALRKLQRRMHVDGHSVDLMPLSWHVQRSGLTG